MPLAQNGTVKIYYQTFGQGEPVVMLIGLGGSGEAWALQYMALQSEFHCITIDNRGAGQSDKPDEAYSITLFAQDLAAVLNEAGIESAHIMGASMGGLIAQEFFHLYPQRVRSLILTCTGVGAGDPEFVWPTPHVLEVLGEGPPEDNDPSKMERYFSIFYDSSYMKNTPGLVSTIIEKRASSRQQPTYANQRQLEACATHVPNSPRLANIDVPTLIVHGEHDQIWPLENAYYLKRHIPGAKLEIIENAAHMLFTEQTEVFNQRVMAFLKSLAGE
ncbi:MAG: alpha/beta hydrolase [Agarilytica sp.]